MDWKTEWHVKHSWKEQLHEYKVHTVVYLREKRVLRVLTWVLACMCAL